MTFDYSTKYHVGSWPHCLAPHDLLLGNVLSVASGA